MVLALTLRSFTSTLLPQSTIGTCSQTRTRSPTAIFSDRSFCLRHDILLTMPVGNILICDAGSDVEHDDAALTVDVVTISETSKFFLSCSIPYIELDSSQILTPC